MVAAFARGISTLTVATVLALTAAGCATNSDTTGNNNNGTRSGASCAPMLKFHGQVYVGTSLRTHPPYNRIGVIPMSHLHKIGVAARPACIDTNHPSANDIPTAVEVARIEGVSPETAIAALPRGDVYLRSGVSVPRILTTAPWIHWYLSD